MSRSFVTTSVPIFVKPTDSDVPVFTKALHRAATGDPSSGQTLGFPLTAPMRSPVSPLAEDPVLVRSLIDSTPVLSHILGKPWNPKAVPEIRIVPVRRGVLAATHVSGLLDVAVLPENKKRLVGETAYYTVRRTVQRLRTLPVRSFVTYQAIALREKATQLLSRVRSINLPTLPMLPSIEWSALRFKLDLQKRLEGVCIPEIRQPSLPKFHISLPARLHLPEFPHITIAVSFPHIPAPSKKRLLGLTSHALLATSIVLFFLTVAPIIRLEAGSWWMKTRTSITGKAEEPAIRETLTDTSRPPDVIPPEDKQFQLLIPKIGANMKVIANVDPNSEAEYTKALKEGVAHAKGTNLPGEPNPNTKTVYIFGHSTNAVWNIAKYNALFYSLKDMEPGDPIIVWYWGKEFTYITKQIVKVDPNDVSYFQPQTKQDQLILQTCWPPGTTWKRLLVIATPTQT